MCHVDDTTPPDKAQYDLIIGMDLMVEIGIMVDTNAKLICWEDNSIPLKERGLLQNQQLLHQLYHMSLEPPLLQQAEEHQTRILDADYSHVDIDDYVHTLTHLAQSVQEQVANTLKKFPELFSGGLGLLKVKPIHLEL